MAGCVGEEHPHCRTLLDPLLQPFPISPHHYHPSTEASSSLEARRERSPSRVQSGVLPCQGPSWDFGRKTSQPGDWALGRASGKVADLTKLLLLSILGLL